MIPFAVLSFFAVSCKPRSEAESSAVKNNTTQNSNYSGDYRTMEQEWSEKTTKNPKAIYDTSLDGFSNAGHEGTDADGMWENPTTKERFKLSWNIEDKAEAAALSDLLEYMKTL